jgi:hypothetical protein
MHALEFFAPHNNFGLNGPPLSLFNLTQFVRLYYHLFVHLVYFGVNYFVRDRLNRPFFYVTLKDV